MKLTGQRVTLIVSDDGKEIMARADLGFPYSNTIPVSIAEAEDLGLWIKVSTINDDHLFLLMWHYIAAIDAPSGTNNVIGLRGGRGPIF